MSLNESIVEDAALIMPAATLTPAHSHGERESFSLVVLVGRLRKAIRRLNAALFKSRPLARIRDALLPQLLSGKLSLRHLTVKA
jgi:hypothetical protein